MSNPAPARHGQGLDYRDSTDVQKVHTAVQREKREPRIGLEPLSLWLIGIYAVATFSGGFYFGRYSGSFGGDSLDPGGSQRASRVSVADGVVAQQTTKPQAAHGVAIFIRNMKFDPPTVEVKQGDVVEWKNDDLTPHTATSASFDSASIEPEKSWRHTFGDAGNFPYACTFHPEMKGVIVVK